MGELTIRRDRGAAISQRQWERKTGQLSGSSPGQKTARMPGFTVSETLRQLMSRVSQAENHSRESHRTLQTGEAALAEVQERLGRMAELAQKAAGSGEAGRAALQEELEQLRSEIDRMIGSAVVGGAPLFLDDDMGMEDSMEALLYAVRGEASAQPESALPSWMVQALTQNTLDADRLLSELGLDRTASGAQLLAAVMSRPLDGSPAASYLAALYLGAVISGADPAEKFDPAEALDGLRQLLEQVSRGVPADQALEDLTDGAFTSLSEFQEQFTSGALPGMQAFLVNLLLADSAPELLTVPSLLSFLAGTKGMELDLVMELLNACQSAAAVSENQETAGLAEGAASRADTAAMVPQQASATQFGAFQVVGRDLSGVSFDSAAGTLTVGGTADVIIQGTGQEEQSILVTGSGTVTLQSARVSLLTADAGETRIFSMGGSVLHEVRLGEGTSLTLGGSGLLTIGALRANESNTLRMTGGAVVIQGKDGETLGALAIPVVLDGPASLAARADAVFRPEGKALEPFDIVWKTLLPGFSAITSMTLDGRHAKMALLGGEIPDFARLWLAKGDPSAHGYPAHTLVVRGRDASGHAKTRYAYLHWNQQAGAFQEISMYPNPFTVTGGEPSQDWIYEEESHTLHILSDQVTAVSGGSGTDANQAPFSGRIALADRIGPVELTLGGVVCRVTSGRAFDLGRGNEVTLLLLNGTSNHFESGAGCAGISLGDGTSLRIDRTGPRDDGSASAGALIAAGGDGGAGIGRDRCAGRDRTSRILICGGEVSASGTGGGAGIGAGQRGAIGAITITGGKITSTGGKGGAGIGGALGAPAGDISIRGGSVTAEASYHAAAIGAGIQGESGDILITGTARIAKAVGGDPGADIGACLFGGCGEVLISGGADIGSAKLQAHTGISLQMGESTVMLPQFRLSSRSLRLDRMSVSTQKSAQAARKALDADCQWVSQIQTAYRSLYTRLEQSFRSLDSVHQYINGADSLVRDTASASVLLKNMSRSIPSPAFQALRTHGKRGMEDVQQLLR